MQAKSYISFLLLVLMISCGKIKVQTESAPIKATVGPDFEAAALFCDNRYGKSTPDAEACFKDYRTFLSPKVSIDLANIDSYCKNKYSTPDAIQACTNDLMNLLTGVK